MNTENSRWGMVIDLNRCIGCQTCSMACKHANDTQPEVQWRSVIDVEMGTFPDVQRLFMPVGCQHCAEPPCVPVCPTGATRKRGDGLVTIDYDQCIGCASCAVACPYQARTLIHHHSWYYGEETIQESRARHKEREGVVQKCTFCVDRIDAARESGLTPGVDWDVTPACAVGCIAKAIEFGDFNDPASNVSRLAREMPHFRMHEELGTEPQIRYLYSTPSVPGRNLAPDDMNDDRLKDPENPLVGKLQKFWDWRAAMNWCFGGLSSGAIVMLWLWSLVMPISLQLHAVLNLALAALMGVGLFFVFLKIGRKLRFWRAILRPQTSWMTRELYVVVLFGLALLMSLHQPSPLALALTALAALLFLFCQARILHCAKGIPNWRAPLIPWMFIATGLLEGVGLVGIILAFSGTVEAHDSMLGDQIAKLTTAGFLLILINAGLWVTYRDTAKSVGIPPLSRAVINDSSKPLLLIGHGLAAILFLLTFALPEFSWTLLVMAGVATIAGGFFMKFTVIVRAGYHQGYALAKLPQRGSNAKAAPVLGAKSAHINPDMEAPEVLVSPVSAS